MILGITGTNGAGKGTAVKYLVDQKLFSHFSVRDLIVEEVLNRGLELTRTNIRNVGTEMRTKNSPAFFVKTFIEKFKEKGEEEAVIESIRTIAEAEYLRENGGVLISIDASPQIRFERVSKREKSEVKNLTEFQAQEEAEYYAVPPEDPNQMNVLETMKLADITIVNDGSLEEFYAKIEAVLAQVNSH